MAATARICLVQDTERTLLSRDSHTGRDIHQIQVPCRDHPIAVGVCVVEVIAGVQEQDGNVWYALTQHMQDNHVFSLEAARYAGESLLFCQDSVEQCCRG